MKLVAPPDVCSASVDGCSYEIGDGFVDVKPEHVAALRELGFKTPEEIPVDPADDPNSAPVEDIATMSRNELFAFLKAKGIAVSLPITNDQLRAVALNSAEARVAVDPAPDSGL